MDGEATDYLDTLSRNEEARDCWCRFHFIRSLLRDDKITPLSANFHKRVMQVIENEPTVFAPQLSSHRRIFADKQFIKPIAGLAIAATVAAVTVMGFQTFSSSEQGQLLISSLGGRPVPIATEYAPESNLVSNKAEMILASDAIGDKLDTYLLGHMEQSTDGVNAQGMLPYVRLAGYDDSQ